MITEATARRLKSARGHLDAVIRMVDDGRYCVDVLQQLGAVQGALEQARRAVLEDHLRSCVRDAYSEGHLDAMLEELVSVINDDLRRSVVCRQHEPVTD